MDVAVDREEDDLGPTDDVLERHISDGIEEPAFYCYAFPEPEGFSAAPVRPGAALYSQDLGQFILPYEVVRTSTSPDATLLEFLQTTYEAAANAAGWDRAELERA